MAVTLGGMTLLTTNDSGTGWAGTDGTDTYGFSIQGANSESWQLSKNATETGTLTASASMPTGRGIYTVWLASSISAIYTNVQLTLQSTAGNSRLFGIATAANPAVDGAFKAFAFDYINKGTPTGTFNPASLASSIFGITTANVNFRAVPNNWIDTIHYGVGHTIAGTTTSNALFSEAALADTTGDFYYGVIENYNGIIYSQGDIDLTGTALVSSGETLVFKDTANGYDTYNLDVSGTVTFTNTSILAAGTVNYNFDTSGATAFTQNGGSHTNYLAIVTAAGQTMDGIVFQSGGTASVANTITSSSFNRCGKTTVTGLLSGCTINKSTATEAVSSATLAKAFDCIFIKDVGASHAIELTGAAGTYTWNSTATGYVAGTSGSGVQITGGSITGNETIHITASSGTFTINVSDGATVPSVSTAGAIVDVVAGQKTFTFTIAPLPSPNYEWRLYTVTAEGSQAGAVELDGLENDTTATQSHTHAYTSQPVAVQVISNDYIEKVSYYTLTASDLSVTINLDVENND